MVRFHRHTKGMWLAGAALGAAVLFSDGAVLADGSNLQGSQQQAPACPDYGSFVVVDPPNAPGTRRGQPITAESFNSCADLPRTKPRVPIDIQIGIFPNQNQIQPQDQGTSQMPLQNRPQFPGSSFGPLRR